MTVFGWDFWIFEPTAEHPAGLSFERLSRAVFGLEGVEFLGEEFDRFAEREHVQREHSLDLLRAGRYRLVLRRIAALDEEPLRERVRGKLKADQVLDFFKHCHVRLSLGRKGRA